MAGVALSAKNSVVRIGGLTLYAASWEVNPETNWEDASHFDGNGFEIQVACLTRGTVDIEGWFDVSANMYDAPLLVVPGVNLVNVRCYLSTVTSPYWNFPLLSVMSVPLIARVADILRYRFRGKASGSFTTPTGNM